MRAPFLIDPCRFSLPPRIPFFFFRRKHKLDLPFSAHVSINGVAGKREWGPFLFFLPCGLATACCDATVTGKNAKELNDRVGGAGGPPAVEMAK